MPFKVEIRTAISAPPSAVYSILMDFDSYPSWNPLVVKLEGKAEVGSTLEAHIKLGDQAATMFKPTVLKNEANKEFRWVGAVLFEWIFRGEHYFVLEETADGCELLHGELFSGLLDGLMQKMYKKDVEKSFGAFNEAIKMNAEGGASA
eukprot:GFKZ01003384.1.p4 GENE.GFKZ01003384.1~~GFKZ01003384.1.p4  ORF type:complete len:148 (+),score=28.83 GFKZ01003384.1:2133-2576(+)